MMSTRLYLRRVMCNSGPGDTNQLSAKDLKRTIISLQGGKSFGSSVGNQVIMETGDDASKPYISRIHAVISHRIQNHIEQYFVEDRSVNGTYVNDRRVDKSQPQQLKAGDTIKFGHRNGSRIEQGEIGRQSDADFAFSVEESGDEETSRLLDKVQDTTVTVHYNTALADFNSDIKSPRVQQEEADSTNGNTEEVMNASSSRQDGHPQYPSTSQTLRIKAPSRVSHNKKFSDINIESLSSFLFHVCNQGPYYKNVLDVGKRLKGKNPEVSDEALFVVIAFVLFKELETKEEFIDEIVEVATGLGQEKGGPGLMTHREEVAETLLAEKRAIKEIKHLSDELSTREENGFFGVQVAQCLNTWNHPSTFQPSATSAFHSLALANHSTSGSLIAPTPIPITIADDASYRTYLHTFKIGREEAEKLIECHKTNVLKKGNHIQDTVRFGIQSFLSASVDKSYLDPVSSAITLQKISAKHQKALNAQEVSVIASVGAESMSSRGDCQPSTSAASDESSADEERHSSSNTSATNSRRRTESNASEILDVVGINEHVTEMPVGRVPHHVDKLSVLAPVGSMTELNGGTQTPSPVLQDTEEVNKRKDVETRKNIEAASKVLRKTATPHGEDQAGPSSISTAPTPVQSPPPRHIASASATPSLSSETQFKENIEKAEEEEIAEVAPVEELKTEGGKGTEATPKVVQKRARKSAPAPNRATSVEQKEKPTPAKSTSDAASKSTARRMMKQLDESGDSDSDDEDKDLKKKKTVRRSTRTVRSVSPKKVTENDGGDDEAEEDIEDDPETPKKTPRGQKSLKRPATKSVNRKVKAKSPDGTEETDGEPPKKRRGRKKAISSADGERLEVEESNGKRSSKKEKCGIKVKWCCVTAEEHKFDPTWVMCADCSQWYHTFCIRLDNSPFEKEEVFSCCQNPSDEFASARDGHVHKKFTTGKDNRKSIKASSRSAKDEA